MKKYSFLLLFLFGSVVSFASVQGRASQTSAPIIHERYSPGPYEMSEMHQYYDFCAIEFENTDDDTVSVYYRYHYCADWDGVETSSDWKVSPPMSPGDVAHVDRDLVLLESAHGWVEAYSVAKNKSESEVEKLDFYVDLYPNHHFTRYYDFVVGEKYFRILSDSTVALTKRTVDITSVFNPEDGHLSVDSEWSEWEAMNAVYYTSNPCYWGDVVIPSTVEYKGKTYTVTSISDYAFECCELTSLELPNTLTSIGECAFYEAVVSDITVPAAVSSMGAGAFANCYSLTSVVLPEALEAIPDGAFSHCYELANVTIPESVTAIGVSAFLHCDNIVNVVLPESVTSIGDYAFCKVNLTSIEIPASVDSIGGCAFSCPDMRTVISHAVIPPFAPGSFSRMSEDYSWDIYNDATLYVPNESLEAYVNHEDWNWFMNIVPFIGVGPGDVDGDGEVAIGDVTELIDQLLDGNELPAYCDVDGNGAVDISDVSFLIDMLLNTP